MQEGYYVEYFMQKPDSIRSRKPLATTATTQAQMYFADNLPDRATEVYWVRVSTIYTAESTCRIQLGLCVLGKGRLYVDGVEKIDLFTSQPEKSLPIPMFDQASMEVTTLIDVKKGQRHKIKVLLQNQSLTAGVGALNAGGLRIGCASTSTQPRSCPFEIVIATSADPRDEVLRQRFDLVTDYLWSGLYMVVQTTFVRLISIDIYIDIYVEQ